MGNTEMEPAERGWSDEQREIGNEWVRVREMFTSEAIHFSVIYAILDWAEFV